MDIRSRHVWTCVPAWSHAYVPAWLHAYVPACVCRRASIDVHPASDARIGTQDFTAVDKSLAPVGP